MVSNNLMKDCSWANLQEALQKCADLCTAKGNAKNYAGACGFKANHACGECWWSNAKSVKVSYYEEIYPGNGPDGNHFASRCEWNDAPTLTTTTTPTTAAALPVDHVELWMIESATETFDHRWKDADNNQGPKSVIRKEWTTMDTDSRPDLENTSVSNGAPLSGVTVYNFHGKQKTSDQTSGSAADSSGAQYMKLSDGSRSDGGTLVGGGSISICTWVKYDSLTSWGRVMDFGNGPLQDNIAITLKEKSVLQFVVYNRKEGEDGTDANGYHDCKQVYNDFVDVGKWMHICATVNDTGAMTMYKNGVAVVPDESTTNGQPTSHCVPRRVVRKQSYIGRSNWVGNQDLHGSISQFVFADGHAMSAEDVRAEYGCTAKQWNSAVVTQQEADAALGADCQCLIVNVAYTCASPQTTQTTSVDTGKVRGKGRAQGAGAKEGIDDNPGGGDGGKIASNSEEQGNGDDTSNSSSSGGGAGSISSSTEENGTSTGMIVGTVVGVLALAILVAVGVVFVQGKGKSLPIPQVIAANNNAGSGGGGGAAAVIHNQAFDHQAAAVSAAAATDNIVYVVNEAAEGKNNVYDKWGVGSGSPVYSVPNSEGGGGGGGGGTEQPRLPSHADYAGYDVDSVRPRGASIVYAVPLEEGTTADTAVYATAADNNGQFASAAGGNATYDVAAHLQNGVSSQPQSEYSRLSPRGDGGGGSSDSAGNVYDAGGGKRGGGGRSGAGSSGHVVRGGASRSSGVYGFAGGHAMAAEEDV